LSRIVVSNVFKASWRSVGNLFCVGAFCSLALSASAQFSSQDSPFSSGTQQQSGSSTQSNMDTTTPATTTQTGPRVLSQQQGASNLNTGTQQDSQNQNQTERNGRLVNQNLFEPPVPLTGFQRLVAASIGRVLPVYGSTLFSNVPTTFAPVDRIPVTPEYVVGPGDELLIRMWGQVTLDGHFTVDRSGNVYIPQVGAVQVAGVPFAKLTDVLRSQIGRTFRNFDLNVNIGNLDRSDLGDVDVS